MPFKRGHLRYFVTVAEEGQVTRAAERLYIAQPALSQAIAHLESDLGFQLLERHPRGVTLTLAGAVFLEKARAILAVTEDAVLTAESLARAHQGTIAFGYVGLPPASSDPGLIDALIEAHPDIQLVPYDLPFPTVPTASWLREVDVAIISRPAVDPNVSVQVLRTEPLVALLPRKHPLAQRRELAVEELQDETFSGFHPSVDPEWASGLQPTNVRTIGEARNPQQRLMPVAEGRCIATAPAYVAAFAKIMPGVVAVPLIGANPVSVMLVARKDRQSPLVEALFATARQLTARVTDGPLPADA